MFFARPILAAGLLGLLAVAGFSSTDASAQQIYRIVGPDGRVTFSDQPPPDSSKAKAAPVTPMTGSAAGNGNLPFELRQVASRYPVTLYAAPDCVPCGAARNMLSNRGIPFAEKTVTSNEDIEALKRLAGVPSLPFLTIGSQQLRGFIEAEWVQYLDAAGYPKTSQLPPGYARAGATPLVAVQEPQRARPQAAVERPQAATPLPVSAPAPADNPTGIRF
jgi:glutaredoxin